MAGQDEPAARTGGAAQAGGAAAPAPVPLPAQVAAGSASGVRLPVGVLADWVGDEPGLIAGKETPRVALGEAELRELRREFRSRHQMPPRDEQAREREIWLRNRTIRVDAEAGKPLLFPDTGKTARGTVAGLIHFDGPVTAAHHVAVAEAGAAVVHYLPNNALLAEMDAAAWEAIQAMATVTYVGPLQPADKLEAFVSHVASQFETTDLLSVNIQPMSKDDLELIARMVSRLGGNLLRSESDGLFGRIHAELPLGALSLLAQDGSVQWIEEAVPMQFRNDVARENRFLNAETVGANWGLTGRNQIFAHGDSGLSTGDLGSLHPDFDGRVIGMIHFLQPTVRDVDGHGTHTAGSILGDGHVSGGQFRGTAPEALLVTQGLDAGNGYIYTPSIFELLGVPYNEYGARLRSDSWGSSVFSQYDLFAQSFDAFIWEFPYLTSLSSAGNAGRDADGNGVIDYYSLGSPAVAKNVIAVGAAESDRPPADEGLRNFFYNVFIRNLAEPVSSSYLSSSRSPDGNLQGMAAFSSRGPSIDGRIKPEIVGPGTNIISTFSGETTAESWGLLPENAAYAYMGGTSMSCPLVAGVAGLVRQYAVERAGIAEPSSAILRAALIGGARSIAPGQYGTGPFQEIPFSSPNFTEGWGQADAVGTVHPQGQMVRMIDDLRLNAGQRIEWEVEILEPGQSFDVALAWVDAPPSMLAATFLVNDLDLQVHTPDGQTLYPNNKTGPDRTNNNETVRIANAAPGVYRVIVDATQLPLPRTMAALYLRGAFDAPEIIVHEAPGFFEPSSDHRYAVAFQVQSLLPLSDEQVDVVWRVDGAQWQRAAAQWQGQGSYAAEVLLAGGDDSFEYYIETRNNGRVTRLPAGDAVFGAQIAERVTLTIGSDLAADTVVKPHYGVHSFFAGQTIDAKAFSFYTQLDDVKRRPVGWSGTGSVPESGIGSDLVFTITEDSSLTWHWQAEQYQVIIEFFTEERERGVFRQIILWADADNPFSYPQIMSEIPYWLLTGSYNDFDAGSISFAGWELNGQRWPDAYAPSPLRLDSVAVEGPMHFRAIYLDTQRDDNGDGLPDYYQLRYFGDLHGDACPYADPDGDGWMNWYEWLDATDPTDANSYPRPPEIILSADNAVQSHPGTWTLSAQVIDTGPVQVELTWWEAGLEETQTVAMKWMPGNVYYAKIQPPGNGLFDVHYFVSAADALVAAGVFELSISDVCTAAAAYPPATLSVVSDPAPIIAATGVATTTVSLSNPTDEPVDYALAWLLPQRAAFAATEDWRQNTTPPVWQLTDNRTWDGSPVWYCGNPATRRYSDNMYAALDTPQFTVPDGGALMFRHWLQAEESEAGIYWDGAVLEITLDDGTTFQPLIPEGGYPHQIQPNSDNAFEGPRPCFGSTYGEWDTVLVDLSAFAGASVRIRFLFASDFIITDEGWYVTDVTVLAPSTEQPDWLLPVAADTGTLAANGSVDLSLQLDAEAMAMSSDRFAGLVVKADGVTNALLPITLIRANVLSTVAHGPGSISPDTAIFRDGQLIECLVQAAPGYYIERVRVNGFERSGFGGMTQASAIIAFSNAYIDQTLEVWFAQRTWTLSIVNERGSSLPAAGNYTHAHGTTVTVAMTTPMLFDGATKRYNCIGYRLSPSGPLFTTASNTVNLVMDRDRTLIWVWQTEYLVSSMVSGKGAVSPAAQWLAGTSVGTISVAPEPAFRFSHWSGDVAPSTLFGDTLVFPVTGTRGLLAHFSQFATENQLIPYAWLSAVGIHDNREVVVDMDLDGDGFTVAEEYHAGTDPFDPASFLSASMSPYTEGWLVLQWNASPGRNYTILQTSNLRDFDEVETLPYPINAYLVPAPAAGQAPRIYSIRAQAD